MSEVEEPSTASEVVRAAQEEGAEAFLLRRNLSCIAGDGAAYSVMVGAGEFYLAAFLLAVGKSDRVCGLVGTVPMLAGAVLQLISPWGIQRLGSHRRWVSLVAALQALCFVPLVFAAVHGTINTWWAFVVISIYWGLGLSAGAAWNAWAETLVPRPMRAGFFAYRTRIAQMALLGSMLLAGCILQVSGKGDPVVFAWLFGLSALARLISAQFLYLQSEGGRTTPVTPQAISTLVRSMFRGLRSARSKAETSLRIVPSRTVGFSAWQLLAFLVTMQMGVYVAGPFFTPYMLRLLEMSYFEYVLLTAAAFVARIITLPWLGRLVARFGPRRILAWSALGIIPLPAAWIFSTRFEYLLVVQLVCGIAWGGYELSMVLLFFDSIPRERRVEMLTLYNLANAAAMALGTFIGAWWLSVHGEFLAGYFGLFALSSLVRLIPLVFLIRLPERVRLRAHVVLRTLAVRPGVGSINRPILPTLEDAPPPAVVDTLGAPEVIPAKVAYEPAFVEESPVRERSA